MVKKSQVKPTGNSSELTQKIIDFFIDSDFKLKESNESSLIFIKGSYIANLGTFDPLNWKSIVTVEIRAEFVQASFDIRTFGQIVTSKELELWDTFIQDFENTVGNTSIDESKTLEIRGELDKQGERLMIWSLIGGALGVITYLLFKKNELDFILAGVAGGVGSLAFSLTYSFASKNKKK